MTRMNSMSRLSAGFSVPKHPSLGSKSWAMRGRRAKREVSVSSMPTFRATISTTVRLAASAIHQYLDDRSKFAIYLPLIDLRHLLPNIDLPGKPRFDFIRHLFSLASG